MSEMFCGMFGAEMSKREREREDGMRKMDMDKKITISKGDFMRVSEEVITNGRFARAGLEHDPHMAVMVMLMGAPLMADLMRELFDKEENEDGRK